MLSARKSVAGTQVALTNSAGSVEERYEYDAYGNCHVLEPNFAPDGDGKSGNPYLFAGRRLDILDNGSLKLQYNRNRYYDQYTGRWLTHDPMGMTPFLGLFAPRLQYTESSNLYEYGVSNPVMNTDIFGMACAMWFNCVLSRSVAAGGCATDCYYTCRETRRETRAGDILMCGDIPEPFTWVDTKRKTDWCCWATSKLPFIPTVRCNPKCKKSYREFKYFTHKKEASDPDRDCSKTACRNMCDGVKKNGKKFCSVFKDPRKKMTCKILVTLAKPVCYMWCDAWCQKP